ncbi:hypothetical protein BVI1335_2510004 [Burkholderia vietnamiensis]|nr:hypothetical protein BVI1335_2510004 [Burkholderia vietnamiensis]
MPLLPGFTSGPHGVGRSAPSASHRRRWREAASGQKQNFSVTMRMAAFCVTTAAYPLAAEGRTRAADANAIT